MISQFMNGNSCKSFFGSYFDGAVSEGSSPSTLATEVRSIFTFAPVDSSIRNVTLLVSLLTSVTTPYIPLVVTT